MLTNQTNVTWHGVSRQEIHWNPRVIAERCIGCGMCVTSCGKGVYGFDYEAKQAVVVRPQMCMVGCTTCATLCARDAIVFPSTGYIRQLIRDRKLLSQSKAMLADQAEKFSVAEEG